MKEIWKDMWTVGRKQEISADADDDESIVSPLCAGDTITFLLLLFVKKDYINDCKY